MITEITSTSNNIYKHIRKLKEKKEREMYGEYIAEGGKSLLCAAEAGKKIVCTAMAAEFYAEHGDLINSGCEKYVIKDEIFPALCDTKTPQGIIAVIKQEKDSTCFPDIDKPYVYCDRISDPGNLGTIIRTADAAGFGGVILSPGCADVYSPKTIRATMGSFFNTKIIFAKKNDAERYVKAGFTLYGGILDENSLDYREADYRKPTIVVVGNEAQGISRELRELCLPIKIPIWGKAESLNASVAAGILIYEVKRQIT